MIVVLLFLKSLRKTFIIGVSIPLAILATFVMMGIGDLTLNIMSLGGLALGTWHPARQLDRDAGEHLPPQGGGGWTPVEAAAHVGPTR